MDPAIRMRIARLHRNNAMVRTARFQSTIDFPDLASKAKSKISRVEKGVIIKTQEELRYMPKEIINACLVLREPGSPVQLSYSRKETRGKKSKTKPVKKPAEKKAKRNHGRLCLSLPNAEYHMS